jgi:hypothetical protein
MVATSARLSLADKSATFKASGEASIQEKEI